MHASHTGARPRPLSRILSRTMSLIGTLIVVAAILVFLFLAVGPRFLGYQTATMLTGSMAPGIVPGDVVVTTRQPVSEIAVGDVISYHIPVEDNRVETHRIIEVIANEDGTTAIRTKGDANEAVDPWTATLEGDYYYREAFSIPAVGNVIRALREPAVRSVLVYGAPAVLVVGALATIWARPTRKDDPAPDTAATDTGSADTGSADTGSASRTTAGTSR